MNDDAESQSRSESTEGSKLGSTTGNWPTKDSTKSEDLIARSDTAQLDFVRTELGICHKLAELATREHQIGGDQSSFEQAHGDAEAAYETVVRFGSNLGDPYRQEILSGLRELRMILDGLAVHGSG